VTLRRFAVGMDLCRIGRCRILIPIAKVLNFVVDLKA